MTVDEQLIDDAVESLDDLKLPEPKRRKLSSELTSLIGHYRNACDLSRLPNPERAEHWTQMAKMFERRIRGFLVDLGLSPAVTNRCSKR